MSDASSNAAPSDAAPMAIDLTNNRSKDTSLYQTKDATLNVLTLTFRNQGGGMVRFIAGADESVIRIGFGGLLADAELAAVKIVADGWSSQLIQARRSKLWELRPNADVRLGPGSAQLFMITVPSVGIAPTSDTIVIEYANLDAAPDDFVNLQMFVIAPPATAGQARQRLPVSFGWIEGMPAAIDVSPSKDDLIPGRLGFFIKNRKAEPLLASTDLGKVEFHISFITIPEPDKSDLPNPGMNALTYDGDTFARAITMTPLGDRQGSATSTKSSWIIDKPRPTGPLVWVLRPSNQQVLGSNAAVEVLIENILTVLPPFTTTLFVQSVVTGVSSYDGRIQQLNLSKKLPEPAILAFSADRAEIKAGDATTLSWRTIALDDMQLSYPTDKGRVVLRHITKAFEDGDAPTSDKPLPLRQGTFSDHPTATTAYTLTGFSSRGNPDPRQVEVSVQQPVAKIVSFALDPAHSPTMDWRGDLPINDANGVAVTLKLEVTDARTLELSADGVEEDVTGQHSKVVTVKKTTTFTLRATSRGADSIDVAHVTVKAALPVITDFNCNPNVLEFQLGRARTVFLNWQTSGVSEARLVDQAVGVKKVEDVTGTRKFTLEARNPDGAPTNATTFVYSTHDFVLSRTFQLLGNSYNGKSCLETLTFEADPDRAVYNVGIGQMSGEFDVQNTSFIGTWSTGADGSGNLFVTINVKANGNLANTGNVGVITLAVVPRDVSTLEWRENPFLVESATPLLSGKLSIPPRATKILVNIPR